MSYYLHRLIVGKDNLLSTPELLHVPAFAYLYDIDLSDKKKLSNIAILIVARFADSSSPYNNLFPVFRREKIERDLMGKENPFESDTNNTILEWNEAIDNAIKEYEILQEDVTHRFIKATTFAIDEILSFMLKDSNEDESIMDKKLGFGKKLNELMKLRDQKAIELKAQTESKKTRGNVTPSPLAQGLADV